MTVTDVLPPRWRHDRLVCSDGARLEDARVVTDDGALVAVVTGRHGTSVAGYGDGGGAARLVGSLVDSDDLRAPLHWLTLPRDVDLPAAVTVALGVEPLPGWDWLSVDDVPGPQPREGDVVRLDPAADASAIRDCLAGANPCTDADPTGRHEVAWWGVPGPDGVLLGVIGASARGVVTPGRHTWHLHGLGVHPSARRRGFGRALTAAAVRDGLLAGAEWVSLGVWADNAPALAMYAALGFRTDHQRRSYRPVGESVSHPRH